MRRLPLRVLALAAGAVLTLLIAGCGNRPGPTGPSCSNLAGAWAETATDSCGTRIERTASISQSACTFSADFGTASVQGSINGDSFTFTGTTSGACGIAISGSGSLAGPGASATYNGTSPGGAGCCPAGPVTGSVTLVR